MSFEKIYTFCKQYTMTSVERMKALYESIQYVLENDIPGDFVECGVAAGGSSMLVAMYLKENNITNRKLYLYDTYNGMPKPDDIDVEIRGNRKALIKFEKTSTGDDSSTWCYSSIDDVRHNMKLTGFPESNIVYIKGKVEDMLPKSIPFTDICILRLDTDWYASTKHELIHLYPLLSKYGILIIDDYGHWQGSQKAVDEYFKDKDIELQEIDYTGRLLVK